MTTSNNKKKFLSTRTVNNLRACREGDVLTVRCSNGQAKYQVVTRVSSKGRPKNGTVGVMVGKGNAGGGTTLTVRHLKSNKEILFKVDKYTLPEGWKDVVDVEKPE
jgi:hypothetical protein